MPTVSWPLGEDEHGDAMASGVFPPPRPPLHPMQGVTPARWVSSGAGFEVSGGFPARRGCVAALMLSSPRHALQLKKKERADL